MLLQKTSKKDGKRGRSAHADSNAFHNPEVFALPETLNRIAPPIMPPRHTISHPKSLDRYMTEIEKRNKTHLAVSQQNNELFLPA